MISLVGSTRFMMRISTQSHKRDQRQDPLHQYYLGYATYLEEIIYDSLGGTIFRKRRSNASGSSSTSRANSRKRSYCALSSILRLGGLFAAFRLVFVAAIEREPELFWLPIWRAQPAQTPLERLSERERSLRRVRAGCRRRRARRHKRTRRLCAGPHPPQ